MSLVAWHGAVGPIAPCRHVKKVFILLISSYVLPLVSFLFFLPCHFFSSHFPKNTQNIRNDNNTLRNTHTTPSRFVVFFSFYFILFFYIMSFFLFSAPNVAASTKK